MNSNYLISILLFTSMLALAQATKTSRAKKRFYYNHGTQNELNKQDLAGQQLLRHFSTYQQERPWARLMDLQSKRQSGLTNRKVRKEKTPPFNMLAEEEASSLGDAARYIADAFSKMKSNSNIQPGEAFQILAELLDEKCGPKSGDDFRNMAKILDTMQRASELLGFSHEGNHILKDFNIVDFLQTFANALDGLHGNGDLKMQDLIQILKTMTKKVGGEGTDEVLLFIEIAVKLLGTVFGGAEQVGTTIDPNGNSSQGILPPTGQSGIHGQEKDLGMILLCSLGTLFG